MDDYRYNYITGHKGGDKKAHTPVETPNNLLSTSYAKILLAVSEGEVAANPTTRDIFLAGTPLMSESGNANFGGVKYEWRSGTQDQSFIPGMVESSNQFGVGFEVKVATPWVKNISTPGLTASRITLRFPALYKQETNGDINGTKVDYAIDLSIDGGVYQTVLETSVEGKTNSEYKRTHRIEFPTGSSWDVRVRRITPESTVATLANTMIVDSYAEVIDVKQRFPNTALLYIEFDASLFGGTSIPAVSVKGRGKIIQVPSNYDPESRTYTGVWNGTFKWAWTNNPAWVFYDLVRDELYGLGDRIGADDIDKWALYQISQYCDVMVSDGKGGLEPRHTCNVYIQSRTDAWKILNDIVSIFNGLLYWDGSKVVVKADMPVAVDTLKTYSRSQVIDGEFIYSATSERTIYTTALVSYDNPEDHYATAVEPTNDLQLIKRYRTWAQLEMTAIGCTSRGEAQRRGKYAMYTNSYNRMVSFKLGLEGYLPRPGEVFGVQDELLAGKSMSGRIHLATRKIVTLDRKTFVNPGDILHINLAAGGSQSRTVQSVAETEVNGIMVSMVTVVSNYDLVPEIGLGWYVESNSLKSQLFRTTKVTYDEENVEFTVEGVEYNDSKFAAIDNGARLESRPITIVPPGGQDPVALVNVSQNNFIEQGLNVVSLQADWDAVDNAVKYEAEWRKDLGDWKNVGETSATGFTVYGIYTGNYVVRVRAVNAIGAKSVWKESASTALVGKTGNPPPLVDFNTTSEIFGIGLHWSYAPLSEDGEFVQIQESSDSDGTNPQELSFVPYPSKTHLKTGMGAAVVRFFRARLIDRSGNEGPWTDWTYGISSADATELLDYLTGQITETQLGQDLLSQFDDLSKIPGIEQSLESVEAQLAEITGAPQWDNAQVWLSGSLVQNDGSMYRAVQDVPIGTPITDTDYWTKVGDYTSLGELVQALAVQVNEANTRIDEIDGVVTAQSEAFQSLTAQMRPVSASGDKADSLRGWYSQAEFANQIVVTANENEAMVRETTLMRASIADNTAAILTETSVRASADQALAQDISVMSSTVAGNTAAIQSEAITRANADGVLTSQVNTAQSTANGAQSTASTALTTSNSLSSGLSSMYSVKLGINTDGKYYAAGMGIGIENTPSGMQSQVIFVADRFAIMHQINGTPVTPFVVQGSQTIINNAVIGDATITFAKITDSLQSTNYVANTTGWKLWKNGNFEINGSVAGQGRLFMNNRVLKIFDGGDNLRVQIGDLTV